MKLGDFFGPKAWVIGQLVVALALVTSTAAVIHLFSAPTARLLAQAYPAGYVIAPTDFAWINAHARAERDEPFGGLPSPDFPVSPETVFGREAVMYPETPSARGTPKPNEPEIVDPEDVYSYRAMLLNVRLVNYGAKPARNVKISSSRGFYDAVIGSRHARRGIRSGAPASTVGGQGSEFRDLAVGTIEPGEQVEVYLWTQRNFPDQISPHSIRVSHEEGLAAVVVARSEFPMRVRLWRYASFRPWVLWLAAVAIFLLLVGTGAILRQFKLVFLRRLPSLHPDD